MKFNLCSGHLFESLSTLRHQDSPSQQIHQVTQKGDICKDFELPLFTSAHFACGRNEGFRTDPIGINKYAKHASPEDTSKQFYLCTAVGIFTKDCWDRKPFPGSISGLAYCFFLSFSVISVHCLSSGLDYF